MRREQRSRNERWQLGVKIVCAAIASLLAGAFTASELFALSTRFSQALGEHYFYLYPPWAIAPWWSECHAYAPALFLRPGCFCLLDNGPKWRYTGSGTLNHQRFVSVPRHPE